MATDKFDRLLDALPKIAEAVNQFQSAQVQEQAFEALVRALGLAESSDAAPLSPSPDDSMTDELNGDAGEVETKNGTTAPPARRRRRRSSAPVSAERDIDFRPKDKQAFRDFVAEKEPKTQDEKNVVAVFYLEEILKLPSISAGRVLAAYRECKWKEPTNLANSLAATASRKHWLDTSNLAAIRTTAPGRNQVEHDMPSKKSAKT